MRNRFTTIVVFLAIAAMALPALAGGRPFTTDLDAANEVGDAAPGDPGTTGVADVTLNQGLSQVCFDVQVEGNNAPITAGHIHVGTVDVNGPVVVDFNWSETEGSGCTTADADLIKDIRQNPENYYVNVHNEISPGGAARGQLSK